MKNDFAQIVQKVEVKKELVEINKSLEEYKFPSKLICCNKLQNWIYNSNEKTHSVASQATVITMASSLTSGLVWTATNAPTSLYLVLILPTGSGKNSLVEIPTKLIPSFIENNNLTSLGGFEDMLVENPSITQVVDEYGDILSGMLTDKNGSLKSIMSAQKSIYSSASGQYTTRRFSTQGGQKELKPRVIMNPCYSIAGLSTEMQLFDKLGVDVIADGFLNRFIFINGTNIKSHLNKEYSSTPPSEITKHIQKFNDPARRAKKIDMTTETKYYYDNIIGDVDLSDTDISLWVGVDQIRREISVRWRENALRVATALAAYERWDTVPLWLLEWSYGFIKFNSISFVNTFENRKNLSQFTETLDVVINWFKKHSDKWMSRTYISNNATRISGMPAKDRNIILNELVERGRLSKRTIGSVTEYSYLTTESVKHTV